MSEAREQPKQPTPQRSSDAASAPPTKAPSNRSLFMSTAPENTSRELAQGKTPREKAYYIFLGLLALAAVVLGAWYLDLFGGRDDGGRARPGGEQVEHTELDAKAVKLGTLSVASLSANGGKVTLRDLKGKVVLLNLWGEWCAPCIEEFPAVAALEEKYRGHDRVRILAVSVGFPDEPEDIENVRLATQAFIDQREGDYSQMRVYLDPDRTTRTAVEGVTRLKSYPTTLLLDGESFVRRIWSGGGEQMQLEFDRAIQAALKE